MGSGDKDYENDSDDEIFAELEKEIDEDFDMTALRERRLEELQQECVCFTTFHTHSLIKLVRMRVVKDMKDQNFGKLTEMADEKEVLKTSA